MKLVAAVLMVGYISSGWTKMKKLKKKMFEIVASIGSHIDSSENDTVTKKDEN